MTFYFHICKIENTSSFSINSDLDIHEVKTKVPSCHRTEHESCCSQKDENEHHSSSKGLSFRKDCCLKIAANNNLPCANETLKLYKTLGKVVSVKDYNIEPIAKNISSGIIKNTGLPLPFHKSSQIRLISYIQSKSADKNDDLNLI